MTETGSRPVGLVTHKQIAQIEHIHIATAYRRHPLMKRKMQSEVLVLRIHNYSIRQIAAILGIPKSTVHRWLS